MLRFYAITWPLVFLVFQLLDDSEENLLPAGLEALDEARDAEIFMSVVTSLRDWEQRKKSARRKRSDSKVCYAELGCFDKNDPFVYLDMLPSTPELVGTKFFVYTAENQRGGRRSLKHPEEVSYINRNLTARAITNSGFNASLPTKVIVHGFGSNCAHVWVYEMQIALIYAEPNNIICVDWEKGASTPNYVLATANTRLVGKQLAIFLRTLADHHGLRLDNTHLIGFSLGAHVAGFAGAELGKLNRITGLDPAGPLFEGYDHRVRLDSTDADFVDVIHSNGDTLIMGGLGSYTPMGHVDFYPNGGRAQKGCSNIFVGAIGDFIWSSVVEGRSLCNHRRAYKFFTDSVSPKCNFPAFPCESFEKFSEGNCFPCKGDRRCGNMGYYADRSTGRGQLYLMTREEEPFCAHQYLLKIFNSESPEPMITNGKIEVTLMNAEFNETFVITTQKDQEIASNSTLTKMIVPHPALSVFPKIQVLYTAYTGWLSSGRNKWHIDKISLSDSFGLSTSICKRNLVLTSGVPLVMPLYSGECNIPSETSSSSSSSSSVVGLNGTSAADAAATSASSSAGNNSTSSNSTDSKVSASQRMDNRVSMLDEAFSSSLKRGGSEGSSRSFGGSPASSPEIVEPILAGKKSRPSTSSSSSSRSSQNKTEITEPILGPTTPRRPPQLNIWPDADDDDEDYTRRSGRSPTFIQLIPLRISDMFNFIENKTIEILNPILTLQNSAIDLVRRFKTFYETRFRGFPLQIPTQGWGQEEAERSRAVPQLLEPGPPPLEALPSPTDPESLAGQEHSRANNDVALPSVPPSAPLSTPPSKQLYVNLPVYNKPQTDIKYIPLNDSATNSSS